MNEHDKDNLSFILSLNGKALEEWYDTLSKDDIEYAMELLREARSLISVHVLEINDDVEDVTEAAAILKKFTLNG